MVSSHRVQRRLVAIAARTQAPRSPAALVEIRPRLETTIDVSPTKLRHTAEKLIGRDTAAAVAAAADAIGRWRRARTASERIGFD